MSDEKKTIVIFEGLEDQPPLIDDEVRKSPDAPEICDSCPLRCGGLVVSYTALVPVAVRAEPGSKERGCKTVDPRILGLLSNESVAVCFHPERWCTNEK